MAELLEFNDLRTRENFEYGIINVDEKEGVVYSNYNLLIEPKYDFLCASVDKTLKAKLNGKEGIIDIKGNIIIPFEYDFILINPDLHDNNYAIAKLGDKLGVINFNNEIVIPINYEFLWSQDFKHFSYSVGDKYGLLDINNNVLIPPMYDDAECYSDFMIVSKRFKVAKYEDRYIENEDQEVYGVIDYDNNILIPFEYKKLSVLDKSDYETDFKDRLFYAKNQDYKYVIINSENKKVCDIEFDYVKDSDNSIHCASCGKQNYVIDSYGNAHLLEYNSYSDFQMISKDEAVACVWNADDTEISVVNQKAEVLFMNKSIKIVCTNKQNGLIFINKDGQYGAVDRSGNIVIPFEEGMLWGKHNFIVRKNGQKWHFEKGHLYA